MFRLPIAAVIGLSAIVSAASADTLIIQSGPLHAVPAHGVPVQTFNGQNFNILDNPAFGPAFGRLADMCDRMGMDCTVPHADVFAEDDPHPLLSPGARADAQKRLDLLTRQWEDYAADLHRLPTPNPQLLFGWNAPRVVPLPRALPHRFSEGFPSMPHTVLPRPIMPRIQGFSGFDQRFIAPRLSLPRSYSFPHGSAFPWPSL